MKIRNNVIGTLYITDVRLAILNRTKCQAFKAQHIQKKNAIKMSMLRWIYGHMILGRLECSNLEESASSTYRG